MKAIALLIVLCATSVAFGETASDKAAVTYDLGGGRFGDKLIGYLHAKWISFRYQMPLLYQPFPYSDQLVMHRDERHFQKSDFERFERTVTFAYDSKEAFRNDQSALYMIPYFPEAPWEQVPENKWFYFPVDWKDPVFKGQLQRMVAPLHLTPKLQLPQDRISVAVHMRLGGSFDTAETKMRAPLKLPPVSFYKEQIKHLYELLKGRPLYVHIFTDDENPQGLLKECQEYTQGLNITYGCRQDTNTHDSNVLEDFFEMIKFDCLIRPDSNYSIIAGKIGDFMIEISPTHFAWLSPELGHVDKVDIKYKNETVLNMVR